ncbi:shikimate kinase [Pedobacter insulae]|uniref:Shikimate kinase n=1 Tax=Pedobacter insulae TaxID=414048 RepID=A0A1I2TML9_9SPHI|nr:shikimate kinase [Pedobacter insulae]SFG66205.1 shikimate kinase [Pedobacter insulae]
MKVFLVGFMGCGKSTKAKQLASRLGCEVVDLDAVIVAKQGKSIAEYFAEHGESAFRKLEQETLQSYAYPENCIVATGGGLPCFFDNMEWMNANGKTVYLKMTPPQLVSRLHNREKRPLLKGMDDEQLLAFIETKLTERNAFYNQAHLVVNAFDLDIEEVVSSLV